MSRGRDRDDREVRSPNGNSVQRPHESRVPDWETRRERQKQVENLSPDGSLSRAGDSASDKTRQSKERSLGRNGTRKRFRDPHREPLRVRSRDYEIRSSDLEMMQEIGKFRTVAFDDLARFHYEGNVSRMKYELRLLAEQGMIERENLKTTKGGRLAVVFLTKEGKRLLDKARGKNRSRAQYRQRIYAGLVKPAEIVHDAAIYRMYQVEAANIRKAGGKVRRVVL